MARTQVTMYRSPAAVLREILLPSLRSTIAMLLKLGREPVRPGSRSIRAVRKHSMIIKGNTA